MLNRAYTKNPLCLLQRYQVLLIHINLVGFRFYGCINIHYSFLDLDLRHSSVTVYYGTVIFCGGCVFAAAGVKAKRTQNNSTCK